MSTDPKATPSHPSTPAPPSAPNREASELGMKIFSYPKIIFLIPTMFAAFFCGFVMWASGNVTQDPLKPPALAIPKEADQVTVRLWKKGDSMQDPAKALRTVPIEKTAEAAKASLQTNQADVSGKIVRRFSSVQNVLGMFFLTIFLLNLIVLSLDFPRFTVIALILLFAAFAFFLLWLNVYFELLPALVNLLESVFAVANKSFYFLFATVILFNLGLIWVTRWLDYWEVLPNEILHNHGPFGDLERFPTQGLKFDKEIPDILEFALLGSGRLVLHIPGQSKSIVLENVLHIKRKEEMLKKLMSRMEVRITTDQEASEPI